MKISAIIPTYNEEKYINRCINSLIKKLNKSLHEIIVIDASENGNTLKKIKKFPVNIVKIHSKKGRGIQLNKGAEIANGDILLFIHADTILPCNSERLIKKNLKENMILSFSLGISDKKRFFRIIEFFGKIRCFLTKIPYGDQCFIMKKDVFYKTEKFPEQNLEDIKFIKKAKDRGITVKILNAKVKISPRKWYKEGFIKTTYKHRLKIFKFMIQKNLFPKS